MKTKTILALLVLALTACAPAMTPAPTGTYVPSAVPPTLTATATFAIPTPSLFPTQPSVPVLTPDAIQVARWREYQTELAKVLLSLTERGWDPTIYKDALCEWDILGQLNLEVYVYAVCVISNGNTDMRSPAIVFLEPDGSIRQVKLPEPKPNSDMFNYDPFPKDAQEKFCYYFDPFPSDLPPCPYPPTFPRPRLALLYAHIEYRKTYPDEPPLVVLLAMSTATPTP
jgi:hypothetical protein